MSTVYIALGSNLGDTKAALEQAMQELSRVVGKIQKVSSFYTTEPVGYVDQSDFLNAVLCLETTLTPQELIETTLDIETRLGRVRNAENKFGPRVIDIDILLYDDQIIHTPQLEVPHPRMHERGFVLVPLAEIAPEIIHPVLKRSIQQLLDGVNDPAKVEKT